MNKIITRVEFFIIEALTSFRRNALMVTVAVGTVTISLTIFGFFLLAILNMANITAHISSKMDVVAFTQSDLNPAQAESMTQDIKQIQGVEEVKYLNREDAWENFKKEYGDRIDLTAMIKDNPLPDTFLIGVRTPELVPSVATKVSQLNNIQDVRYSDQLLKQIRSLVDAVRIGGLVLTLLLFLATLLIVVNTIRLTVLARQAEIEIMRLVGATNSFIRWPFIVEGILIGIIGGTLSIIIVKFSYEATIFRLMIAMPFLPVINNRFVLNSLYTTVGILAAFLGSFGGYLSVSKILKD